MANSHVKRKIPSKTGQSPGRGRQMKERCWGSQPRGPAAVGWTPWPWRLRPLCSHGQAQRLIAPTPTNVAAGMPSGKVRYAKLSSPDGGHINSQKETSPAKESLKPKRCPGVVRPHVWEKSRTDIPFKAIACAFSQFLVGAFLIITGCLLLAGYISKVGASRAFPVLTVGILVFLPGFYYLIVAYRAYRGCPGCSFHDLPDFDH
ncbi:transmembrane protein 230-like [Oryx dammah]|uniref:transmembrane protein 230-like n=1 Tax=Oryx dammah TaxID=59534 RepID=UPI001A9AA8E4|nr:transmembrane protein 230-like [Oryx dammah]